MNFSTVEILLLAIQIMLIPLARYILRQEKKEITTDILTVINEHYLSLESLIDNNRDKIFLLENNLKHRSELSKMKQEIIQARIRDIELYLKKENGFQTREINQIDDSGFL